MKYSENDIVKVVNSGKCVRLNLALRVPVYGIIAKLNDFEDLLSKGFFRFVMNERLHSFNEAQTDFKKCEFTKIMSIKEVTYIKEY
jgi:hypothetical protein